MFKSHSCYLKIKYYRLQIFAKKIIEILEGTNNKCTAYCAWNLRKNLRHEKDVELECEATSLKEKQNLEGLVLEWIEGDVNEVHVG